MLTSGKSESELVKAAVRRKLPTGWKDGDIEEVSEDISSKENPMFKCLGSFVHETQEKWSVPVYLVDKGKGAVLLRRLCAARGVAAKYDAGCVDASDLVGPVRMKLGIDKRRGWPDRLKVEDFAPRAAASSSVVNFADRFGTAG
jgi:hypothetical protein